MQSSAPVVFAHIAQQFPAFAEAFQKLFATVYAQPSGEGELDRRMKILIYLSVLAALGAEESFAAHLQDAEQAGISRAAVLEAALTAVPAVGITPILKALSALVVETPPADTEPSHYEERDESRP